MNPFRNENEVLVNVSMPFTKFNMRVITADSITDIAAPVQRGASRRGASMSTRSRRATQGLQHVDVEREHRNGERKEG